MAAAGISSDACAHTMLHIEQFAGSHAGEFVMVIECGSCGTALSAELPEALCTFRGFQEALDDAIANSRVR